MSLCEIEKLEFLDQKEKDARILFIYCIIKAAQPSSSRKNHKINISQKSLYTYGFIFYLR